MLRKVDNAYVKEYAIPAELLTDLNVVCQEALTQTHANLLQEM